MPKLKEPKMGRVTVTVELANYYDVQRAEHAPGSKKKVRKVRLEGTVDTGAARLVIPEKVVQELNLPTTGEAKVRYADNRRTTRRIVKDVWLRLEGREGVFNAIVEPDRKDALIGAIVMEDLDFVVDCVTGKLHPRDPDHIFSEIE